MHCYTGFYLYTSLLDQLHFMDSSRRTRIFYHNRNINEQVFMIDQKIHHIWSHKYSNHCDGLHPSFHTQHINMIPFLITVSPNTGDQKLQIPHYLKTNSQFENIFVWTIWGPPTPLRRRRPKEGHNRSSKISQIK